VNVSNAFTHSELHGTLKVKYQRLVSAERDGYIKTETHSSSTRLRNTNIVADWLRLFADTSSKTAAKDELSHPIDHHAGRSRSVSLQSLSPQLPSSNEARAPESAGMIVSCFLRSLKQSSILSGEVFGKYS